MVFYNILERKIVEKIFSGLSKTQSEVILDIGSSHFTTGVLHNYFPNSKIMSINLSKSDLEEICKLYSSDIQSTIFPILASAEKLPFKDNMSDIVFGREVFEHLFFPDKFLNEAKRVSKHNSNMIQITPNLAAWHNRILLLLGYSLTNYTPLPSKRPGMPTYLKEKLKNGRMFDHPRVFTYRALKEIFDTDGLELIEISDYNYIHEGRKFNILRKIIHYITPKGWREDVVVYSKIKK